MEQKIPNLSTDVVKDMIAESPAKEPKAVVADRIPKLPKYPHWAVKAVVEPYLRGKYDDDLIDLSQ